jgi:hypothetical protein
LRKINKWRRVMAVGCSHGDLANKQIQKEVLEFARKFKPEIRFDLGDLLDTAAMRHGAHGTPDEGRSLTDDYCAAVDWLKKYEPTHITFGNHDARMVELCSSPNAVVSYAANKIWTELNDEIRKLKAQTREYDYEKNWFEMGGTFWGHGFWYNENAVRDTAEYLGGPVVMAHLHAPQQTVGRTRNWSPSFCVGTIADIDKLTYARRRRATARWGAGVVFGEVCDTKAHLWLASAPKGESLRFPI